MGACLNKEASVVQSMGRGEWLKISHRSGWEVACLILLILKDIIRASAFTLREMGNHWSNRAQSWEDPFGYCVMNRLGSQELERRPGQMPSRQSR